jgi:hypothetical protein
MYSENILGYGQGIRISDNSGLGVSLDWYNSSTVGKYQKLNVLGCKVGYYSSITENLIFGLLVFNPFSVGNSNNSEIKQSIIPGIKYVFNNSEFLFEYELDKHDGSIPKFAFSHGFSKTVLFSVGLGIEPIVAAFGVSVRKNRLGISISSEYNFKITASSYISMSYEF